jgi:RHS repeat-associated protein
VAEPTCNPDDGQIYFTTGSKTINVATTTAGANMRYTFGTTLPTSSSGTLIASSSGTVSVTPTVEGRTLNIIAFKTGMNDSAVHSATYYYESGNFADPGSTSSSESAGESELADAALLGAENGQPVYDPNGNLTHYKGWVYTYDAQNRLRLAHNNGTLVATYYYDGKNRQIARSIDNVIRFSVWDGWELIEEYGSVRAAAYLQGATGVIKSLMNNVYYYQDKLGSSTHVANASGALLESYRYDLYGSPTYYDANGQPKATQVSGHGIVDLYAGERWVIELGLYDLRNRFMSPELGRFLQSDPIGIQIAGAKLSAQQKAFFPAGQAPETFASTELNLYRYCHNDPANETDPDGLITIIIPGIGPGQRDRGGDWSNEVFIRNALKNFKDGQVFSRDQMKEAMKAIEKARANGDKTLNIAGYSLGGAAGIRLAGDLAKAGIGVDKLLTIDIVRAPGFAGSSLPNPVPVPSNVKQAFNYYQQSGGFAPTNFKGTPVADGPNVMVNQLITPANSGGLPVHHAQMPSIVFGD